MLESEKLILSVFEEEAVSGLTQAIHNTAARLGLTTERVIEVLEEHGEA